MSTFFRTQMTGRRGNPLVLRKILPTPDLVIASTRADIGFYIVSLVGQVIFYISLHPFLLYQPYLPYILSDPLLFIPAASFPFIFHRALSFISFRFLHPGTESVIFEQLVSLIKLNICPVCTCFFQIVPIYKLSFSQKINFFDSIYCIILVIKSYSRGERPAQESVPPERYIVAGRQLFPAVVLQLFWKGDGNRWLMQLFGERQNRKESFGNLLKNTKISPEQ